jgi:hypothetical protein
VGLQPFAPIPVIPFTNVIGHRLTPIPLLHGLDFEPHLNRFPGLKPEIDDPNLPCPARFRRLLKSLVDHGPVSICIVHAEDRDRLVMLCQLVHEVLGRSRCVPL